MLAAGLVLSRLPAATLDLATATIPDLQEAYAHGLTAERVVRIHLQRIAAYDQAGPEVNAILTLNPRALDEARDLDAERATTGPRSMLHGVPILVKDNIDTADLPTTGGALVLAGSVPPADAFVVARLRAAGAIVLAKTNLDEFARGATGTSSLGGQTLNPYNPAKIPGGSSSGSAVGVAALFGWASIGTETGSSLRNPATKNNLVAFCPSSGLVSRGGVMPSSLVFDRVGSITRNVTDAVLLMQVMAGIDPRDLTTLDSLERPSGRGGPLADALRSADLRGTRIGVLRQLFGRDEEDQTATALVDAAIKTLRAKGAEVIDPLPTGVDLWAMVRAVSGGDGDDSRAGLDAYFKSRGPDSPIHDVDQLAASAGVLGRIRRKLQRDLTKPALADNPAYRRNYQDRVALQRTVTALMDDARLDVLIYPHETKVARTVAVEVPDGGESDGPPDRRGAGKGNTISSATGFPTMVVPLGFNVDGVGVGLEFLGRRFAESTVVRVSFAFEQAAPARLIPPATPLLGIERIDF